MAIPTRKDADLVAWSTNANTVLVASGVTDYFLTAAQVTQYTSVHTPMVAAYNAMMTAREGGTRAKTQTAAKNSAKAALLKVARKIYTTVQANDSISDELKIALGVKVKASPSPRPAPATAPVIVVKEVYGHNIRLQIKEGTRRGRAPYAIGATLFSYVGDTAPAAGSPDWKCEGNVTRGSIIVLIPETYPAGTKVYFTAFWYSERGLSSPACTPVLSMVGPEGAMPLAA